MNFFKKALKGFTNGINIMVVICAILMIIVGIMQILFRYVLQSSLSWSEEFMRYLHVWVTTIGGSLCFYEGMFTTINLVADTIKKKAPVLGRILILVQYLLAVIFFGIMLYYGTTHCMNSAGKVSSTTNISMGLVYMCIPLAGFFGLGFCVAKIPEIYRKLTGKEAL